LVPLVLVFFTPFGYWGSATASVSREINTIDKDINMRSEEYSEGIYSGSYKENPYKMGSAEFNEYERGVTQSRKKVPNPKGKISEFNASYRQYSVYPYTSNTTKVAATVDVKKTYIYDKNK
jgi:hypothetical protein